MIDDRLNMKANKEYKQTIFNDLKKKEWILRKSSLDGNARG